VPFAFPATNPPPTVQINVRSNHYVFRAANAGRFLQVERHDGVPGSQDQVSLQMETARVAGLRFTPQHPAMDIVVRGALEPAAGQRVICDWSGAGIPAGAAAEFRLLNSTRGFEFRNDTGAATQPTVTLRISDAATSNHTTAVFGPFNVPAGALQQIFIHDWPVAHQVRSEVDLDRDGTADQVRIVAANPATPLALHATLTANQIFVTWPRTTLDVRLETTTSLALPAVWTQVDDVPEAVGDTMRVVLPAVEQRRFFRLRY
jgi:hypothetical protein